MVPFRRGAPLGFCVIAAGVALLSGGNALAQTRHVAVLDVSGPGSKRVRAFLESRIEADHKLVVREAVMDAAKELGIRRHFTRPSNLRRIARKARVDAVVSAYVYRARRRWWLGVRVYDGGTGKVVRAGVVNYAYFALNKWTKSAIAKVLTAGLEKVEGVPHPRPRRIVEPDPDPVPKKKKRRGPPLGPRPSWSPGIYAGAGIAVWGRRLTFTNLEGEAGSQVLYETNSPVVPLAFFVEAYPGAFITRHRVLANIGLGFSFQRAVGVVSYRESENVEIATTIQRVGGYLVYRWNVNQSATSPELKFSLGVEALEFSFGQDLGLVSGVLYLSFKPEIRARFPLGTERVSLGLQFAGLAVASMGQMADAYHYGNGRAGGVEVGVELDVRLFWKVHLLAGFNTSWLFISFSQLGDQHLDYEFVADSARDGYYGGYLMVSVQY